MSLELELAESQERCANLDARLQMLQAELKALQPPERDKTEIGVLQEEEEEGEE